MIVFYSMVLVILLLMGIYQLQYPDARIRRERPIPRTYALISMGYITFWAALRTGFADTATYILMFKWQPKGLAEAFDVWLNPYVRDKGYDFLQILFKTFVSTDFHWWFAAVAIATGTSLMLTYRRHSENYLYSIFLLVTSTTVLWMFNGIRQFLVASVLFAFGYLIQQGKFVKFLIVLTLCAAVHGSAWIMLPMYFFVLDKPFSRRMNLFILAVLFSAISISPFMDTLDYVVQDTHYQLNIEQFEYDDGVHPLRVLFSAIPVILSFIGRKKIIALKNKYIYMCVNMSVIATGLYFVGMFTSGIMIGRLPIYFSLYSYILLPYIFNRIFPEYTKLLYFAVGSVYVLFFFVMYTSMNVYYISDILGNFI